jgi:hypothetical protein
LSEIAFSDNYSEVSDNSGFQFEFYCEHCRDAWRTEYKRYLAGTASGILDTASSLLGGLFGGAARVGDHVRDAGYRMARDKAFAEAIEGAKVHFHRCRRCTSYVCAQCFNPSVNLCTSCAPSVEEEANVAAREMEVDLARTKAQEQVQAGKLQTDNHVICSACQARVAPSKFCSECGAAMVAQHLCVKCGTELQPGTKFCSECGTRQP